jgi:hypothetical protein
MTSEQDKNGEPQLHAFLQAKCRDEIQKGEKGGQMTTRGI